MIRSLLLAVFVIGSAAAPALAQRASAQRPQQAVRAPDRDYLLFVASEATDRIALVRFGPKGAVVERELTTGIKQADVDGPHGVAVSPDGRHYYVTTAHGVPFGSLWKYTTVGDTLVARVELGNFPATAQVTPDGDFVYVVNFNLHGEHEPSSVSIVAADEMVEIARLRTCVMPHGSRITPDGTRHYSACMMNDVVVEIDTREFEVSRHFMLSRGSEHGMAGAPGMHEHGAAHGGNGGHSGHGMTEPAAGGTTCSPTWAQPSANGQRVYVACNASNDIVELDVQRWTMVRRIPAGQGVYNLATTHDGTRLVATNKRGQSVSVIDLATGRELASIPTIRRVVHGVVISPDDRYAFVSVEGVGAEPGTVEVIDLAALRSVARVDVGQMAGGIDFWKTEPTR